MNFIPAFAKLGVRRGESLTAPSGSALFGAGLRPRRSGRPSGLPAGDTFGDDGVARSGSRSEAETPPSCAANRPHQRRLGADARGARGSALIVTVLFLTLITLLAMTAAIMLRLELGEAKANTHAVYARELADGAADYAISLLRQATPAPGTTQAWVVAPGRAWYSSNGQWTNLALYTQSTPIPGRTTGTNAAFYPPGTAVLLNTGGINLNDGLFVTGNNSQYYNWIITNGWLGIPYQVVTNVSGCVTNVDTNGVVTITGCMTNFVGTFSTNWNEQTLGVPLLAGWVTLGANGQPGGYYGPANLPWFGQNQYDAAFNTNVNPVVARIAVWIDADACKINLNTAGYRDPASTNRSNPRDIDLRALEAPFASATHANIDTLTAQTLTTPEELRRYTAGWTGTDANDFIRNKFSLSVAGGDTNTDAFGRARVNLNGLTMAYTNHSVFSDTLWATMLYGHQVTDPNRDTLLKKYGRFGIAQIVANIVEYKNPANTASAVGSETRDGDGIPFYYCGLKKGPMINAVIVHVATNAVANTTNTEVHCYVDVKLVNGYQDGGTRGAGWWVKTEPSAIEVTYLLPPSPTEETTNFPVASLTEKQYQLVNGMPANSYGLLGSQDGDLADMGVAPALSAYSITLDGSSNTTNLPPRVTKVTATLRRVRLLMDGGDADDGRIVDWMAPVDFSNATATAGLVFGTGGTIGGGFVPNPPTYNGSTTNAGFMPLAVVKQDPRVRTFTGWSPVAGNFANNATTILSTNWLVYPTVVSGDRQWVMADASNFSFDSTISPNVYGLLADLRPGTDASQKPFYANIAETGFLSAGELGQIHTGYPWRTIRFRSVLPETTGATTHSATADARLNAPYRETGDPNTANPAVETNALPDWVLLDMFTATNATSVAGKININGAIHGETVYLPQYKTSLSDSRGHDHFLNTTNTMASRLPPIRALLANTSSNLTHNNAALDTIANNIINRTLVPNSPYAGTTGNRPPAYLTPGEICEVAGLGYFNDASSSHPSSADREQAVRRIGELVTTRSDTFTIWAVAQVIKERKYFYASSAPMIWTEPDGQVDWVWFHPKWQFGDGDGDEDTLQGQKGWTPDFILAEVRMQTVVQRYVDGAGNVCFRTLYTRYWSE